mmetsp:Transcript_12677/g.12511  ORF Transcript_12677/g.12511 Transcript_12677/m.12511 type:complete len:174 (+) Transcript_12677:892-1413(+)
MVFIVLLNKYRTSNESQLTNGQSYKNLCNLMLTLLDHCYKQMDVITALKIMIFSNTFYLEIEQQRNEENESKEFLQGGVGVHPIWHDLIFWEKAIYECIQGELKDHKQQKTFDLTREIVFAKLSSLSLDMMSFDIPRNKIKDLITIFAKRYRLQQDQIHEIYERIENYKGTPF